MIAEELRCLNNLWVNKAGEICTFLRKQRKLRPERTQANLSPVVQSFVGEWSGGAKVLCILDHRGVQLILAYSWARPAILVVGKGRGGMFLFLLFLHFHSCSSFFPVPLFHLLYSLLSLFSLSLGDDTK